MNDDFMQKLLSFLQQRRGGDLVPMSKGGFPMGGANDYLQPPRPPAQEQMPSAPPIDLQSLIRMLSGSAVTPNEMNHMSPMFRGGVDGRMVPNNPEFPHRLQPHAMSVRG